MATGSAGLLRDDKRGTFYTISSYDEEDEETEYHRRSVTDDEKQLPQVQITSIDRSHKSISHHDHRNHKFYKPTSNRTWVLTVFLVVLGICILLLELAIAAHPDSSRVPNLSDTQGVEKRGIIWLQYRQEEADSAATTTIPVTSSAGEITPTTTPPTSTEPAEETAPTSTTPTSTVTVGQPNPADQISITDPTTSDEDSNVTVAPNPVNQLTITSDDPSSTPINVPQPSQASQLSITDASSAQTATAENKNNPTTIPLSSNSAVPLLESSGPSAASIVAGSLIVSAGSVLGTVGATSTAGGSVATLTGTDGAPTTTVFDPALGVAVLTGAGGQVTATVSFTGNVVLTDSDGRATETIEYSGAPSRATTSAATTKGVAKNSDDDSLSNNLFGSFNQYHYFVAMYMPNIIGVILQSTWLMVFATFKMMDPYYQLAKPGGASAQATLTAEYLSSGLSSAFSRAALDGHWVMLLAGLVQFGLGMIMLLISETMSVVPTAYCKTEISDRQPCSPKWVVNIPVTRIVEVCLVACFSMVLSIIVLNRKRISGVYSDPSKIATMADILVHKPLINELRDLPSNASKEQIEIDLRDSRYMLGTFEENNKEHYGIIKLETEAEVSFKKESFLKSVGRRFTSVSEDVVDSTKRALPYLPDFVCMSMCIVLFMLILIYAVMPPKSTNSYNAWMSSGDFGPNLVLNLCTVIIVFLIKKKERCSRLSHPYVLLSKGPQPASETITAGTRATQFTAVFHGLRNGDLSLGFLAMAAIFADFVLILLPGIPFSASQTTDVYFASTYICLALVGTIFAVHVRTTFKEWRRGQLECPDTLAAVLMRLCASRFVEEKNQHEFGQDPHTELAGGMRRRRIQAPEFGDDDERKQRLRYEGEGDERRYVFGCMEGVDGVQRYMVEEKAYQHRG